MSRIRNRDTNPEKKLLAIVKERFFKKGFRYRRNYKNAKGKPDIAFLKDKIAIFVDGAFWHGYRYKKWIHELPKKYWQGKILRNIGRDRETNHALKEAGWRVVRLWEHELKNPSKVAEKIYKAIKASHGQKRR